MLIMCLFSDGLVPPGSSILLARTRQEATGLPTAIVDDLYWYSPVLLEFAVVAIANFLSEFGQLSPRWRTQLRRVGIAAEVQLEPWAGPDVPVGCIRTAKRNQSGEGAFHGKDGLRAVAVFNWPDRDRRGSTATWIGHRAACEAHR
jgi:hypothetical protein